MAAPLVANPQGFSVAEGTKHGLSGASWKRPEDEPARQKRVRLGVVAAQQFVAAELNRVTAADHGDIVGNFGSGAES